MNKFERLLDIEEKFDLSDLYINGIWIYPIIKQNLFVYELSDNKSTIGHHRKQSLINKALSSLIWKVKNKSLKKLDILIVDSSNSRRFNESTGFYESIYTDYLYELFPDYNLLTYEKPGEAGKLHYSQVNVPLYYPDLEIMKALLKAKLNKNRYNLKSIPKLKEIVDFIGTDENFYDFAAEKISRFFALKNNYSNLLEKTRPQILLLINAYNYSNMAFVYAAKLNNITTVELQHGFIRKDHPGYIYRQISSDKLFPDYILTYGNYFTDLLQNKTKILENGQAISVGSVGLAKSSNNVAAKTSMPKDFILITSQWSIRDKLKDFVLSVSDKLGEGIKIVYKTHPLEQDTKSFYKEMIKKKNIILIDDSRTSSLELMRESFLHSTAYSTSFMEAHYLSKPTLLIHVEGYSHVVKDFVDNKTIFMAKDPGDFINKVEEIKNNYDKIKRELNEQSGRFYAENPEQNVVDTINKLIR